MIGNGLDRCAAMPVHLALHRARLCGCIVFVQAAFLLWYRARVATGGGIGLRGTAGCGVASHPAVAQIRF
jgi:hypothetical protein